MKTNNEMYDFYQVKLSVRKDGGGRYNIYQDETLVANVANAWGYVWITNQSGQQVLTEYEF